MGRGNPFPRVIEVATELFPGTQSRVFREGIILPCVVKPMPPDSAAPARCPTNTLLLALPRPGLCLPGVCCTRASAPAVPMAFLPLSKAPLSIHYMDRQGASALFSAQSRCAGADRVSAYRQTGSPGPHCLPRVRCPPLL